MKGGNCSSPDMAAFEFIQLAIFFAMNIGKNLTSDQKYLLSYFLSSVSQNLTIIADFESQCEESEVNTEGVNNSNNLNNEKNNNKKGN